MKAQVRKLRVKLKPIKKGNSYITEYFLCVKAISNLLLVVGDVFPEPDQIDSILDGLLEEYNMFVVQMYGTSEPQTLYGVEALLLLLMRFFMLLALS